MNRPTLTLVSILVLFGPLFDVKSSFAQSSESNACCADGVKAYREGNYKSAEHSFLKALEIHATPDQASVNLLNNLWLVYKKNGDETRAAAIDERKRAVEQTISISSPVSIVYTKHSSDLSQAASLDERRTKFLSERDKKIERRLQDITEGNMSRISSAQKSDCRIHTGMVDVKNQGGGNFEVRVPTTIEDESTGSKLEQTNVWRYYYNPVTDKIVNTYSGEVDREFTEGHATPSPRRRR